MSLHSLICTFNAATEDFPSYVEHFQQYFKANKVESEDKCCAMLLTTCGPATYQRLRCLATPNKQFDHFFEELIMLATNYYHPTPSLAVQCLNSIFKIVVQENLLWIMLLSFVALLSIATMHPPCLVSCDHFLCGINDQQIQYRLVAEK